MQSKSMDTDNGFIDGPCPICIGRDHSPGVGNMVGGTREGIGGGGTGPYGGTGPVIEGYGG